MPHFQGILMLSFQAIIHVGHCSIDVVYKVVEIVRTEMGHGNILLKGFGYEVYHAILVIGAITVIGEGQPLFLYCGNDILWKGDGGIAVNEVSELVNEGHGQSLVYSQRMSREKFHEVAGTMTNSLGKVGII
jgi:hypothetical protein